MHLAYPNQITMKKTPAYFEFANIPELIYKMDPKIKLLLIIRNPVTRAVSSFTEFLAKYQIKYDPNNHDNTSKLFEINFLENFESSSASCESHPIPCHSLRAGSHVHAHVHDQIWRSRSRLRSRSC